MVADQAEDQRGIDLAQAHAGTRLQRHRPREAPAVAVKHRQRPQVDRMQRHRPGDDVRHRVQIRAAVMGNDALRIAGGAGGVVQRDRVPLVGRQLPCEVRVAIGKERFIRHVAEPLAGGRIVVVDLDHERAPFAQQRERLLDHAGEFAIGQQHLGFAVLQREGDRFGVEPCVQRVEHCAGHRHREVGLEHRRYVGQHHRDGVADADAAMHQAAGQATAARVRFTPGLAARTVDDRGAVRIHVGRALDETDRRQCDEVGLVLVQTEVVGVGSRHFVSDRSRAATDWRLLHPLAAASGVS